MPNHFETVLRPHRSLSLRGFLTVMGVTVLFSVGASLYGLMHGAWPVLIGALLPPLIVWFAFRESYKSGQDCERISLSPHELQIEDYSSRKGRQSWRFNPAWVTIDLQEKEGESCALVIRSHGKGVQIGDFLTPAERRKLARELKTALRAL